MNIPFEIGVVLFTVTLATITDLYRRTIYRSLTVPVFLGGLLYSLTYFGDNFQHVAFSREGMQLLTEILWAWLSPELLVFMYVLILFWLGIVDGGDGHLLIAITPWLGERIMQNILLVFYPIAFCYLFIYLVFQYKFDLKALLQDQLRDTYILLKHFRIVIRNIVQQEPYALIKDIPYQGQKIERPPAGIAITIAVIWSIYA